MKVQRWLSMLLALCMVAALLPAIALAEENVLFSPDVYSDVSLETATGALNGSGTEQDPFQIWTVGDLYLINYVESWNYWNAQDGAASEVYYYRQMADLDLSGASQFDKPYGYITANFGGVYDGNGFKMLGMTKPLFYFTLGSYTGDGNGDVFTGYRYGEYNADIFSAEVKNLTIEEPNIDQTVATDMIEQIGAVAAYAVNTTFYNCHVEGGTIVGASGAAAIAGRAGSIVMESCSSSAAISSGMHRAAGLVSNLRIYDTKKGADSGAVISNCAFSGSISGPNDGSRGTGGIVGGVYADDGEGGEPLFELPLFVKGCTFSGTIEAWSTNQISYVGGILGVSFNGTASVLENNTVSGTITAKEGAGELYIGGVLGGVAGDYDGTNQLQIQNNNVSGVALPQTDSAKMLYVGTKVGTINGSNRIVDGPLSISSEGANGECGVLLSATLADGFFVTNIAEGEALVLPNKSVTLHVQEGAVLPSLQGSGGSLNLYNAGEIGNLSGFGNIIVYANSGTIGNIESLTGTVTVGASSQASDEKGYTGNSGTIGDITAQANVTVNRNVTGGTIGDVTSLTGSVTLGQKSADYHEYNTNTGSVGNISAATTIGIYGGEAGSVAYAEEQAGTIHAGTSVEIGFSASGTTYANGNRLGNIEAGTSVTIYNGAAVVGDVKAAGNVSVTANAGTVGNIETAGSISVGSAALQNGGNIGNLTSTTNTVTIYNGAAAIGTVTGQAGVTINANAGTIGNVTAVAGAVTVGGNNQSSDEKGIIGNTGKLGDIKACTSITVYRNAAMEENAGTIGSLTAETGSVTIGQNTSDAAIAAYNTNSGTIGNVTAATTFNVYSNVARKVAHDGAAAGTIEAGTAINVGSTTLQNGNTLGNISSVGAGGNAVSIYNNELGSVANVSTNGTSNITIGTIAVPNAGPVGDVSAANAGVTGYTTAQVGTVTALTDTLIRTEGPTGSYTAAADIVVSKEADKTLVKDTSGALLHEFETESVNITVSGNRKVTVEPDVVIGALNGTGQLTIVKNEGTIQSIVSASSTTVTSNTGTIGTITVKSSNLTVSDNSGTISGELQAGNGSISVTNKAGGTITGNITYTGTGTHSVSVTNANGATMTGSISNPSGSGNMSINNQNPNAPISGTIINNSGTLTLSASGYTKDSNAAYTGTIRTGGTLVIGGTLGANSEDKAIDVEFFSDFSTVTANGDYYFYLKLYVWKAEAEVITTATLDNGAFRNTIDFTEVELTNLIKSVGAGTDVKLKEGNEPIEGGVENAITVSGSEVTEDIEGLSYFAGSNLYIPAGRSVSVEDSVKLISNGTVTILNYGAIGSIRHTGTGTLNIYNLGEGTIGNISSNGTVNIVTNTGTIGFVYAAAGISVGANNASGEVTNQKPAGQEVTYYPGNGGLDTALASIGSLSAGTGNVVIYRNVGTIGNVESRQAGVQIGQNNATYAAYNTNAGTIARGDVNAKTSVSIYSGTENGSVAEGGEIKAGTSVAVGFTANSIYYPSSNTLGHVIAGTSISIYQDTGEIAALIAGTNVTIGAEKGMLNGADIGLVEAKKGTISIYNGEASIATEWELEEVEALGNVTIGANGGIIGAVHSRSGSVTVGAGSKKQDLVTGEITTSYGNNSAAAVIGNISGATGVTISRNLGTIASVTAESGNVTVGQNTTDEEILAYNGNSGSIGSVTALFGVVYLYTNHTDGKIATGDGQEVRAGSSVTIGNGSVSNGNQVGPVYAGTSISVYNSASGQIESLYADTSIGISVNGGSIGNVEAVSSISIGNATTANAGAIGAVTSTGSSISIYNSDANVEAMNGYTGVTVYANAGTIPRVVSENGSVTIGSNSKNADNANGVTGNTGSIEEIEAKTSVTICRNTGTIGTVAAKTGGVTIGQSTTDETVQAYNVNAGAIGSVTGATSVNIYTANTEGTIAMGEAEAVSAGTSVAIGNTQVINGNTIGPVTAGTSINIGGADKLNAGTIESVTTAGGNITAYNNATIGSLNVDKTYSVSLTLGDGAQPAAITTADGNVTVTNTGAASPVVNVTTSGGNVTSAKTGDVFATINVTTTDEVVETKSVILNGEFSTLIHNGTGTVYLETKETAVGNIVKNSTGEVKVFGSAGSVTENDGRSYVLSLVQNGNQAEIYFTAADSNTLPAGTLSLDIAAENATVSPEGPYTVAGGTASEKIAVLTLGTSGETVVEATGTFTPQDGQEMAVSLMATTVSVPALVDRIDTVFVANAEEFAVAKATYGWEDTVAEPDSYPVLAVMPVVGDGFADVSLQVDGTVIDDVGFAAVDMTDKTAGSQITVEVDAAMEGYPAFSGTAVYVLTAADIAKADTSGTEYYYVTYQYMDAVTSNLVEPVVKGESVVLPIPERDGYTFLGWIASGSETVLTAGTSYTPDADVTLGANWAAQSTAYTLTIEQASGGEVVRVSGDEEFEIVSGTSFAEGTTVMLKANNYSGYRFSKWVVTGTENYTADKNILTVTMDGNVTVEANFSRNSTGGSSGRYIVSVESTENGTVTAAPRSVARGETVTITATPDEGYTLSAITAVDSLNREVALVDEGGGVYTFTMPASKVTVRAEFIEGQTEQDDCEYGDDCAAKKFTDLNADAWYHQAVDYSVVNGMMNGISSSEFAPDADLSRAMMVQVLYNLEGGPSITVENVFRDVDSSAWFAKAITWAVNNDIVAGYGDDSFGPDDSLTREQMATILYRYAQYKGYDVTASDDLSRFTDASEVSDWALEAMKSAVGAGLIAGKDDSKLDPAGTATRAEVAQILMNFCENIAK